MYVSEEQWVSYPLQAKTLPAPGSPRGRHEAAEHVMVLNLFVERHKTSEPFLSEKNWLRPLYPPRRKFLSRSCRRDHHDHMARPGDSCTYRASADLHARPGCIIHGVQLDRMELRAVWTFQEGRFIQTVEIQRKNVTLRVKTEYRGVLGRTSSPTVGRGAPCLRAVQP